ncbi:MAG: trehalose-phosphatase [Candidatus Omnitrophica bacterium]|nr:trehalose-phosphatase [Candidatus Omnitrophota bacterium]
MEILDKTIQLPFFWNELAQAERCALLLDYDGTLAPFVVKRNEAKPYPGVAKLLRPLVQSPKCRTVLVSGRPVSEVIALLGVVPHPEIWGCHGWERMLSTGELLRPNLDVEMQLGLGEMQAWAEGEGLGEALEIKPYSIAFHWRGREGTGFHLQMDRVRQQCIEAAKKWPLEFHEFDGGLEIRAAGRNKGTAVEAILQEIDGKDPVAYLGDDKTDEDAFQALGERGLCVLVRPEFRETRADLWVKPPEELLEFLGKWLEACEAKR